MLTVFLTIAAVCGLYLAYKLGESEGLTAKRMITVKASNFEAAFNAAYLLSNHYDILTATQNMDLDLGNTTLRIVCDAEINITSGDGKALGAENL